MAFKAHFDFYTLSYTPMVIVTHPIEINCESYLMGRP